MFLEKLWKIWRRSKRINKIRENNKRKLKIFEKVKKLTFELNVNYDDSEYTDTYFAVVNLYQNNCGERKFEIFKSTYPKEYDYKLHNQLKIVYEWVNGASPYNV